MTSPRDETARLYLELMKRCLLNQIYAELEMNVRPYEAQQRQEGLEWPAAAHTMIGRKRLDNIQFCIEDILAHHIPGDLIETGVWRGGAIIFMRSVLKAYGETNRQIWGADSFCGFPAPNVKAYPVDSDMRLHEYKELSVPLAEVKANFDKYDLLDEAVSFLPGFFSETLPGFPIEKFSLIRLDGDLYESTIVALESLYPKLSIGGYLIVDDYAIPSCHQAVCDYRAATRIAEEIIPIDWTGVYWRRLQ